NTLMLPWKRKTGVVSLNSMRYWAYFVGKLATASVVLYGLLALLGWALPQEESASQDALSQTVPLRAPVHAPAGRIGGTATITVETPQGVLDEQRPLTPVTADPRLARLDN